MDMFDTGCFLESAAWVPKFVAFEAAYRFLIDYIVLSVGSFASFSTKFSLEIEGELLGNIKNHLETSFPNHTIILSLPSSEIPVSLPEAKPKKSHRPQSTSGTLACVETGSQALYDNKGQEMGVDSIGVGAAELVAGMVNLQRQNVSVGAGRNQDPAIQDRQVDEDVLAAKCLARGIPIATSCIFRPADFSAGQPVEDAEVLHPVRIVDQGHVDTLRLVFEKPGYFEASSQAAVVYPHPCNTIFDRAQEEILMGKNCHAKDTLMANIANGSAGPFGLIGGTHSTLAMKAMLDDPDVSPTLKDVVRKRTCVVYSRKLTQSEATSIGMGDNSAPDLNDLTSFFCSYIDTILVSVALLKWRARHWHISTCFIPFSVISYSYNAILLQLWPEVHGGKWPVCVLADNPNNPGETKQHEVRTGLIAKYGVRALSDEPPLKLAREMFEKLPYQLRGQPEEKFWSKAKHLFKDELALLKPHHGEDIQWSSKLEYKDSAASILSKTFGLPYRLTKEHNVRSTEFMYALII
jgi:hypothetical protein